MSANDRNPNRDPVPDDPAADQSVQNVPETRDKTDAPAKPTARRIHTEPDYIFPEIVESAARQSAS